MKITRSFPILWITIYSPYNRNIWVKNILWHIQQRLPAYCMYFAVIHYLCRLRACDTDKIDNNTLYFVVCSSFVGEVFFVFDQSCFHIKNPFLIVLYYFSCKYSMQQIILFFPLHNLLSSGQLLIIFDCLYTF